jgi:hypothetical protein
MPKRFYVAWGFAVVLAAVLPIAIPYAIWPPTEHERGSFVGPDQAEIFERWALSRVSASQYFPYSVSVEAGPLLDVPARGCGPAALHSLERSYTATVTTRGPYGIPMGSVEVSCENQIPRPGGGLDGYALLGLLALLGGVAAVSAPFVLALKRRDAESADRRQNEPSQPPQTGTTQW